MIREKLEVLINMFSVHRIKDNDLREAKDDGYREISEFEDDHNDEFPLVAEMNGEIKMIENTETPHMIDVLYWTSDWGKRGRDAKGRKIFHEIGSIYRTSLIQQIKILDV